MNQTRNDVVRSFWARFMEAKVGKDGQVPGFARWHDNATPHARQVGERFAESCWLKVSRGREVGEVVAAGVNAFRADLKLHRHAVEAKDPVYAKWRFDLVHDVLRDGARPFEVAAMLEQRKFEFPEIGDDEIELYREWGEVWGGPIPEGRPVWNPATGRLEEWPHRNVVPVELVRSGPAPSLPSAQDDEPPPPEYA